MHSQNSRMLGDLIERISDHSDFSSVSGFYLVCEITVNNSFSWFLSSNQSKSINKFWKLQTGGRFARADQWSSIYLKLDGFVLNLKSLFYILTLWIRFNIHFLRMVSRNQEINLHDCVMLDD